MVLLNEEHHDLRQAVREFAESEIKPKAMAIDRDGKIPPDILEKMAELGYMGVPYPDEWGGAGMDMLSYAIAVEEVSRVCASTGLTLAAHTSLGIYPIYAWGTKEQKERYVRKLATGEWIGAFGLTQAVQQAFNGIPGQREVEVLTTFSAQIQQPLPNGSWEIDGLSVLHAIASMYGLMTFVTRQILA